MRGSLFMTAPSRTRARGGGLLEHSLQVVAAGGETGGDVANSHKISGAYRRAEAHRLEHLGHLAAGEGGARLQLLTERLGAVAAAGQRSRPAEHRVRT